MKTLSITLIGDGRSDKALVQVVRWLANNLYPELPNELAFADFRTVRNPPPKGDVAKQVSLARALYPCDIVVYHRDAETNDLESIAQRKAEVLGALSPAESGTVVCVVPVRMMETWMLIDPVAIKQAAGNRKYKGTMDLPSLKKLESLANPKDKLDELVKQASELKGRKLDKLNERKAVHDIADYITDYSPLRSLGAFQVFEADFSACMSALMNSA